MIFSGDFRQSKVEKIPRIFTFVDDCRKALTALIIIIKCLICFATIQNFRPQGSRPLISPKGLSKTFIIYI